MADVIYMPQDPRAALVGQGIGGLIGNVLGEKEYIQRTQAISNAVMQGQTNPTALMAIAGSDPRAQKFVQTLMQGRVQQAQIEQAGAETEGTKARTKLTTEQTSAAEFANSPQMRTLTMQRELAAIQQARAATAGDYARADLYKKQVKEIDQRIQLQQEGLDIEKEFLKTHGFNPVTGQSAAGTEGATADAGTGTGTSATPQTPQAPSSVPMLKPAPTAGYSDPNYNLNTDLLSRAAAIQQRNDKINSARGDERTTYRLPGTGITISDPVRPQMSDKTASFLGASTALAEALDSMKELYRVDKDGKLHVGPISGRLQELKNKFAEADKVNDPNILFDSLGMHTYLATFQSLGTGARGGIRFYETIREALASDKVGTAAGMVSLQNSARLLRTVVGQAAMMEAQKNAKGFSADALDEINSITKELTSFDPNTLPRAKGKSTSPSGATPGTSNLSKDAQDLLRALNGGQ